MLGEEEDVFDSVTWESPPAAPGNKNAHPAVPTGPGFRQSTAPSEEGREPYEPKWEGYLITSVKDPVKELAETKDAYVSYLVSAKVNSIICILTCPCVLNYFTKDKFAYILNAKSIIPKAFPRLCVPP